MKTFRQRIPWAWLWFCLWLGTAVAAAWLAEKVMDYKGRTWKAHVFPISSLSPKPVKSAGAVEGKKVGWLVGDSRAEAWPRTMAGSAYHWESIGVSGYTTMDVISWLDLHLAASGPPDVVVVQMGINDIQAAGYQLAQLPEFIAAAKKNFTNLVTLVNRHNPECQCILTTIIPHGPFGWRDSLWWKPQLDAAVSELNAHIKSLQGAKVSVLDSFKALETERYVRASDSLDGLHLNASGYQKLATALEPLLPQ